MYRPNLKVRIDQLNRRIEELKRSVSSYPEGNLWITQRGKYFSCEFKPENGPARYLSKKDQAFARDLAYKKYLEYLIEDLEASREAILNYQTMFPGGAGKASEYLLENKGVWKLLKDCFPIENAPLAAWANRPPATSAPYQEKRIIECLSGHVVRSKSEALIDTTLFTEQTAFRYEDPLTLGNETIHPDFTIRHPQTGDVIYWDHFGMMDDPKYIRRAGHTLELYALNGYVPFQNLIVTFETDDKPLDAAQINMIMDYFF